MELRQTLLSKSAIKYVHANLGSDFMKAYLFVRLLSAQYKHPIILNYKSEYNNLRLALNYSDAKFRGLINLAIKLNLAQVEGKHLRLLSATQDRKQFKQSKRNDYRRTINPVKFKNLTLFLDYIYSQEAVASKKDQPSLEEGRNSDRVNQLLKPYKSSTANNDRFCSARGVMKALGLTSTSQSKAFLDSCQEEGLIELTKHNIQISKGVFRALLSKNVHNVRYDKPSKSYYVVLASTVKLNYTLKRTQKSDWQKMSHQERIIAEDMGWTKDILNNKFS